MFKQEILSEKLQELNIDPDFVEITINGKIILSICGDTPPEVKRLVKDLNKKKPSSTWK